jgi:hypothetical protein
MAFGSDSADPPDMKKRTLAAVLWFYTAWYAGAIVAHMVGVSAALGPILGTAAAVVIAGDPRGLIWNRTGRTKTSRIPAPIQTPA